MWKLVIFSSVLLILSFNWLPPVFVFVALVPLFLFILGEKNWKKLFLGIFIFRLLFALGTMYFVIDPILFGSSLLFYMGFPISIWLFKKIGNKNLEMISLPVLWTIWDYLQAQYTALPMTIAMLGIPLASSDFLGLARFGGIIGLTFFAAAVNSLFAFLFLMRDNRRQLKFGIITILFIFAIGWRISYFVIKDNKNDYLSKERILNVEILSAGKVRHNFDSQLAFLRIDAGADLLIVPENFYKSDLENSEKVIDFYKKTAVDLDVDLNTVALRRESGNAYKSSFLFSKEGEVADIYDKNYLTITSEHWPFASWRPFYFDYYLGKISPDDAKKAVFDRNYELTAGLPGIIKGNGFSFAAPVCGEAHYPGYLGRLSRLGPDFILNNSNNDWIVYGIEQYLNLTNRLRMIEAVRLNKPILVSGIKEYAGIFYPDGRSELGYPKNGLNLINLKIRY